MIFRDALQAEINLQGLSVARVAEASGLSKGAIYNILNGTTEDARIRPTTRKALAFACNRKLRVDGDGVAFVEIGAESLPQPTLETRSDLTITWMEHRPFLAEHHAGAAFDWLQEMEVSRQLSGLGVVNRVYQNRPDFLSITIHNKGTYKVTQIRSMLRVVYGSPDLSYTFPVSLGDVLLPGALAEQTVFICVGNPYVLSVEQAECSTGEGTVTGPAAPVPYSFGGGHVD